MKHIDYYHEWDSSRSLLAHSAVDNHRAIKRHDLLLRIFEGLTLCLIVYGWLA